MRAAANGGGQQSNSVVQPLPVVSALVVDPVLADAFSIASALDACRIRVTIAETFAKAKERLTQLTPDVLVTAIRLAEYNGLQLVLRAKTLRPDTVAIVLAAAPDPVLQADAEAMGATFAVKPIVDKEIVTAIFRTFFRQRTAAAAPLRAPFDRRTHERRTVGTPPAFDRRTADRRRDLESLLRIVARRP